MVIILCFSTSLVGIKQMRVEFIKHSGRKKQLNLSNYYSIIFQPVLQMYLLQEEQPQQIVNFHSTTKAELIMSVLITKLPTIKPGAEQ